MIQPRVRLEFTHFISLSIGNQEEQLKGIEKFQNMLQNIQGIGEKKSLKKMHVTMMTLNATQEELAALEFGFKLAGDRYSDVTGEGPFIIGFRGLEQGDGEGHPIFMKVELGVEILNILRGILEDELHGHLTDPRFLPHSEIYGRCNLSSDQRNKLFKTADQEIMKPVSIHQMTLRQRKTGGEQPMEPIT